jgi:hypothetical protein
MTPFHLMNEFERLIPITNLFSRISESGLSNQACRRKQSKTMLITSISLLIISCIMNR